MHDVWVTTITGIAGLGIGTAIAAVASEGATLTAAGTAALRARNLELAAQAAPRASSTASAVPALRALQEDSEPRVVAISRAAVERIEAGK